MKCFTIKTDGLLISYQNKNDFEQAYNEIFVNHDYEFVCVKEKPRIIDVGSNIGLAAMYFKKKYPGAYITCFEPNPFTFELLKKNIAQNNLKNVELVNAAAFNKVGVITCYGQIFGDEPSTLGNTVIKNMWSTYDLPGFNHEISVKSICLSDFIHNQVDLLKLDIEGAELVVLNEINKKLSLIDNLILEHHYSEAASVQNNIEAIETILSSTGFAFEKKIIDIEKMIPSEPTVYGNVKAFKPAMAFIKAFR